MSNLLSAFRAFVVDRPDGGPFTRGLREMRTSDLPPGEVTVRVTWSSVNFKDGLAAREDGRVARSYPLVPGIDLAGEIAASDDPAFPVGMAVLANGYEIGTARHGGYADLARIPSGWVVPLPGGLGARDAMAIGTAGFTAAMSVAALEDHGLQPGGGPVLVTGASGGVGSTAIAILASRGHEVWAATGKDGEHDRLRALGAAGFLTRDEVTAPGRPLDSAPVGGRRRHGWVGDAALRAADPAHRSSGRVVGQRQRRGAEHHRVPVHPARCVAAGDGLREHGDRAPAGAVGPHRGGPAARAALMTVSPR